MRRSLAWDGRFVVMHAGNVGLAQHLHVLVEAAENLRGHSEILFVVVGDGAARPGLERKVVARGLSNVVFLPYRPKDEVASLISAADVHLISLAPGLRGSVVPSKMYGILAAGRPFVAAVDPGSEPMLVMRDHQCGAFVQAGDSRGLSEAILQLRDADLDELGARARRAFEERYTREMATSQYRRLLEQVATERV
jgi:glycosyltransferase involved in cell wall biosynthesis